MLMVWSEQPDYYKHTGATTTQINDSTGPCGGRMAGCTNRGLLERLRIGIGSRSTN
jgi:hypothetical protein